MEKRTFTYPTKRKTSLTEVAIATQPSKIKTKVAQRKIVESPLQKKSKTSENLKLTTQQRVISTPNKKSSSVTKPKITAAIPMKRYGQFKHTYEPKRALGVDQGYANCGYSIVEWCPSQSQPKVLEMGVIETKANLPMGERLCWIENKLMDLAHTYDVSAIGCEKLFVNPPQKNAGTQENPFADRNKSASIVTTSMVSGIIHMIAYRCGLFVQDYTPGTVKKQVTGNGRASKDRVYEMVYALIPEEFLIKKNAKVKEGEELPLRKPKDHETDAVAIAITTIREYFCHLEQEREKSKQQDSKC